METLILFNLKDVYASYDFANALKKEFILHSDSSMDHMGFYDAYEERLALEQGLEYGYAGPIHLDPENPNLLNDWKYAPFFKVLQKTDAMQMVAIFVLLSFYISVISLAAVGVMAYVRSLTIAVDNQQLFWDIRRLGANPDYVCRVIRMQLRKIFTYPTLAGCGIVAAFALFMLYFNDMRVTRFEIQISGMLTGQILLVFLYMYVIYWISFRQMKRIIF